MCKHDGNVPESGKVGWCNCSGPIRAGRAEGGVQVYTLAHDRGSQPSLEEEGPGHTRTRPHVGAQPPAYYSYDPAPGPVIGHPLVPHGRMYTPSTSRAYNTQARHAAPVIS